MSRPWTWWLAWGSWVFTAACGVALILLFVVTDERRPGDPSTFGPAVFAAFLGFQSFATVGALVAARQPGNAVGWLFCAGPALCQWANVVGAYAFFAHERGLPGVVWPSVIFAPTWGIGVVLVAVFGFLLFPNGRPLSRRWGWVIGFAAAVTGVVAIVSPLLPGEVVGIPAGYDNPIGVPGMNVVSDALWFVLLGLLGAAVVSLVLRFRRSRGVERQQLKVFVAAVCFVFGAVACFALLHELTHVLDFLEGLTDVVWLLLISLIPVSVGVAILRYRLYEIDQVISKTLVYGSLTVVLGATYVGFVLAGQATFSSFAGGSDLTIAVSTLVVAGLFLPLRSRVQRFVDRRFYRRRYDAQRTLERFGARLREQVELSALERDLQTVVTETMQPAHASLWLRTGARG